MITAAHVCVGNVVAVKPERSKSNSMLLLLFISLLVEVTLCFKYVLESVKEDDWPEFVSHNGVEPIPDFGNEDGFVTNVHIDTDPRRLEEDLGRQLLNSDGYKQMASQLFQCLFQSF
jgi:hypothetical protein